MQRLATKHGVSADTVRQLYTALAAGGGRQAQFSIPELGGMGQWSSGGMLMVADMFNDGLKAKVAGLCSDLSGIAKNAPSEQPSPQQERFNDATVGSDNDWYPSDLGKPSSSGSQNSLRYAFFPSSRRLAIKDGSRISVYDTGSHEISHLSQQQASGEDLAFASQQGVIEISELPRLSDTDDELEPEASTGRSA